MARRLRIGFVCEGDPADVHTWSGIPHQILQRLRAAEFGVDVEVLGPLDQRKKVLLAPYWAYARTRGTTAQLHRFPTMRVSYANQIARWLRRTPVDVIVSTSSIPVADLVCEQPIVLWQDAVFQTMVGYYDDYSRLLPRSIRYGRQQERTALQTCAVAAYASEWAARGAGLLTDPAKVTVLPFGASFSVRHGAADIRSWTRARRRRGTSRCELLFIGVDWDRKGGAIAVETARILNRNGIRTRLTVVGCRPPKPLPDWVRVLGFISKRTPEGRDRLEALLQTSDLFILPTQAEAAGIVFCEASAYGLPSLAYATGGVPDYVRDGVTGICLPPGTPAAGFASAIADCIADEARYERLCRAAFEDYETRLNWDTSVHKLIALCDDAWRASRAAGGDGGDVLPREPERPGERVVPS